MKGKTLALSVVLISPVFSWPCAVAKCAVCSGHPSLIDAGSTALLWCPLSLRGHCLGDPGLHLPSSVYLSLLFL